MGQTFALLVTVAVLLSSGCASQPTRESPGSASSLQRWVDAELAPYLVEHLGGHPRFKGESMILVSLDGADIQPDIDGLTRSLRDQLMDRLLAEAAVTLPWQPQQPPAQHHRRLDQAQCTRIRDAHYYIGIEISRTATAQYRVSVRALDVRAGEWVTGFGKTWSGALSPSELRALQERRSDESLRGLRVLPFSSDYPDLAARYLANNLSCLLLQQGEEDLVLYVESSHSDQPDLRTLLGLVGNNLSRYHEVRVTDRKTEANFVLRGEVHELQAGLNQVWVVLHPKNSGEHLIGVDTDTYIRVRPAGGSLEHTRIEETAHDARPAIAEMELVRRNAIDGTADRCNASWQNASGNARAMDDCPVLELTVERADEVFVFVHGTGDGISRLSSGTCSRTDQTVAPAPGTRSYRFPAARFHDPDWPTVYAIAVSGSTLARQFRELLQLLPDACGNASGMRAGPGRMDPWLNRLDRLIAANSDRAVWTARRIP